MFTCIHVFSIICLLANCLPFCCVVYFSVLLILCFVGCVPFCCFDCLLFCCIVLIVYLSIVSLFTFLLFYRRFARLCEDAYLILRRHAGLFINMLAMMLQTGIPELRSIDDLNYVR